MSETGCDTPEITLLPFEDALARLLEHAGIVDGIEELPLKSCLDRVLAEDLISDIDVPPAANSAMDGYAIRSSDITAAGDTRLRVTQRIPAGETGCAIEPGEAARIFTGAPVPPNCDAVVMQEQVTVEDEFMNFSATVKSGQNIRDAGEDICRGQTVIEAGRRLRAQELGLAASIGQATLKLRRKLKVGVFFSGDELLEPGQPLEAGKIYDSNRYTLTGLLQTMGCEIVDLGIVGDTLEQTRAAIERASTAADLVITTGGASVGEEDHIRVALEQLGQLHMWRLNIKPGKPLIFGQVGGAGFIGLPGNPVSVYATFCLFVAPYIKKRQGRPIWVAKRIRAGSLFTWPRPDKRREFARARLLIDDDGQPGVDIYPNQGSGVLTSTSWADGLVVINESTPIHPGDQVEYMSFQDILE